MSDAPVQMAPGGSAETPFLVEFERVFQAAPVAMLILDADLRYVACNDLTAEINGIPCGEHIGRTVGELLPELASQVEPRFRSVFENGRGTQGVRVVGSTPKAPGVARVWLESISPLKDISGRVRQIVVGVQEITALAEAEASLRDSEHKFRASQQLRSDNFAILRAVRAPDGQVCDFTWEYANPSMEAGLGLGPLAGRSLLQAIPETREHPGLFPRYVRLLAETRPDEIELEVTWDGAKRLYRNSAVALDRDHLAVAMQDLSDHMRKEEQLRLATDEFRHRVKNVIAITLGLLRQTAKSAPDAPSLCRAVSERLEALAASQDLLMARGGEVTLRDVVDAALRPFGSARLQMEAGPAVSLPGASVSPLTLALNELATNAIKYGALSIPEGSVALGWTVSAGRVTLTWREDGGPTVEPPHRAGLGTRLLADAAANLPHGLLEQEFAANGLRVVVGWAS